MSSSERFTIRLLAALIPGRVEAGTMFAVEYDPASQWFAVASTIAAQYLQEGGRVGYAGQARQPEVVTRDLSRLGVDVSTAMKNGRLLIDDWYSAALAGGRMDSGTAHTTFLEPIEGGTRLRSLKMADLSIEWLKAMKSGPQSYDVAETWPSGALSLGESLSVLLRFNEERTYLEWEETRSIPNERKAGRINISGYARGVHTESFYKRIESTYDGLIEIKLMEQESEVGSFLRLTNLRGQPHDARWHKVEIRSSGEAILAS